MSNPLIPKIIEKYLADREDIKALKAKHAEELRVLEEFQSKREQALLDIGDMTCFAFFTDLFINGRDGKAEKEKEKVDIGLQQAKIEQWLLKMLSQVGEGIRTEFGTVFKTRKESVSVADFDMFVEENMLKDAAVKIVDELFEDNMTPEKTAALEVTILKLIKSHMHLELLNKAVNKTAILELMGDQNPKDHSRPNPPPAGVNYVAIQSVGVRKK